MSERATVAGGARAGIVTRAVAFVLDTLIVVLGWRGSIWVLDVTAGMLRRFAPPVDIGALIIGFLPLAMGAYHVIFWWTLGQTPGKWLLGVKVVAQGGRRMTLGRCLLRVAGYALSALPCYLGSLWVLGPKRLAWHDQLAHTEVVYVARRLRPWEIQHTEITELSRRSLGPVRP